MITRRAEYNQLSDFLTEVNGEPWMADAACRGSDPDAWFPDDSDHASIAAAKQICASCPVQLQCGRHALNHPEPSNLYGIWGGLTETDRRRIRKRRQRGAA